MKHSCLFIIFIFSSILSFAQVQDIGGLVLDADNKEPLAFVSISLRGHNRGAISDIDGKWNIKGVNSSDSLVFSIVGYRPLKTTVAGFLQKYPNGNVLISKTSYNLKEVTVRPGINPAHRIIQKALDNKKKNNWERIPQWTYRTYSRFHVTRDRLDSIQASLEKEKHEKKEGNSISINIGAGKPRDTTKAGRHADSLRAQNSSDSFFNTQHLFMIETVTEKKFKYPDKVKEVVLAAKTSGSEDPRFSLVFQQFNNFNIYKDYIEVGSKQYLSPLAYGCISKYLYVLEDSIRSGMDTVYVISYRPRRSTLFSGFAGLLYINTRGYAVQNVIALPKNIDEGMNTEIQQQFTLIDGKTWFPEQVTTNIVFGGDLSSLLAIEGKGKSYIKDVNLHAELSNKQFNNIDFDIDKNAVEKSDTFWARERNDSLSKKDRQTYKVIDSLCKAINLDKKIKYFEALYNGRLGIGKIDVPFDKLFGYNGYEGFRLGAGLYTNDKLSRYFSVGGYGAYGFKDKAFKYGTELFLTPVLASQFRIRGGYYNDVAELGGVTFPMDRKVHSKEPVRNVNISRMYTYQKENVAIRISPFRYLTVEPAYSQSKENIRDYYFIKSSGEAINTFQFSEASIGVRYAYKEKFMQLIDKLYSQGTKWPIIWGNIAQGLNNFGMGQYNYRRYDVKIEKTIPIKLAGHSDIQIRAGYVDGDVPLLRMYSGNGDRTNIPVASENTFETMRPYEFFSSKYAAVFYSHSFEKLLFQSGKFQPVLAIHANAGVGTMGNLTSHSGLVFKTMEKGYYEAGISIDDIFKSFTGGFGVGVYYRYGPYSDTKAQNNLMFKLVFTSGILGD